MTTTTLYRPVGTQELALIEASGWRAFPPRLPEQPIFYPVTNEAYAYQIARDWNARHNDDKRGYVTKFEVLSDFLAAYERRLVGSREHEEFWIPAEDLDRFNQAILGEIVVVAEFASRFGLEPEEYGYARELAQHAAHGAWATKSRDVEASRALLDGNLDESTERELLLRLLQLAAHDPDHEWEAPTLTGQPTSFAVATLKKLQASIAAGAGGRT